jgi:hypothetical protein
MSQTQIPKQRHGQSNRQKPESELDVYDKVVSKTVDEGLLGTTNLGLGNLDDSEYYQQVDSFRSAMFADAAFSRVLLERAIKETLQELAKNGWTYTVQQESRQVETSISGWEDLEDDEQEAKDYRRYVNSRGAEIWEKLPQEQQREALQEFAGFTEAWKPPHWKMIQMRNEASRSRGARLMDNALGRVREIKNDAESTVKDSLPGDI